MHLENEIKQGKTLLEKTTIARQGIRDYIDNNTIPLIVSKQVSLMDYGDVCWALGMLTSLAEEEANRIDKEKG